MTLSTRWTVSTGHSHLLGRHHFQEDDDGDDEEEDGDDNDAG